MHIKILPNGMSGGKIKIGEKISKKSMFASIHRQRLKSSTPKPTSCENKKSYVRVALHGDGKVGKSCILERLTKKTFTNEHVPTVSEVYETELQRNGKLLDTLWLYDTAGSMDFPVMNRLTITKSDACVVVYSVDSVKSLEYAAQKLQEIAEMKGRNFPCVLVGNKTDLPRRQVTFDTGLKCAVKYGASYIEMSAKTDVNVQETFETVLKKIQHIEQFQQKVLSERRKIGKCFSSKR